MRFRVTPAACQVNVGTVVAGSGRNVIADEAKMEIEVAVPRPPRSLEYGRKITQWSIYRERGKNADASVR